MRVIGYIHVSTEEQAADGVSLANQRENLTGYAKHCDLDGATVIKDAGRSGKPSAAQGCKRPWR